MAANGGLREAAKEVRRRASAVLRLQAELAKAELASTGKNAAAGTGLVVAAAFVAFFALALLTTLFVVALALAVPLWLSVLIVFVVYVILAGVLGLLARSRFRRVNGVPLASEQARRTRDALGLGAGAEGAPTPTVTVPAAAAPAGPSGGSGDGSG